MGGLGGHMNHLYDNPRLTFGSMMDIMKKAAKGELIGTEKTDGQNLFLYPSRSLNLQKLTQALERQEIKETLNLEDYPQHRLLINLKIMLIRS